MYISLNITSSINTTNQINQIIRDGIFKPAFKSAYHSEWQWLLRKFWPQLIFKKARDILEGVKQTCPLHPLGLNIKHLYWNESKGNCYCRLESLKSKCRKFSFDNLKIQTLRRVERIPAWELLQSFSAPQVTRSTVTNQQKTAGEE